jgi:hypothetical protein
VGQTVRDEGLVYWSRACRLCSMDSKEVQEGFKQAAREQTEWSCTICFFKKKSVWD